MVTRREITRAIRKERRRAFWAGVKQAWPVIAIGLFALALYIVWERVAPNH